MKFIEKTISSTDGEKTASQMTPSTPLSTLISAESTNISNNTPFKEGVLPCGTSTSTSCLLSDFNEEETIFKTNETFLDTGGYSN